MFSSLRYCFYRVSPGFAKEMLEFYTEGKALVARTERLVKELSKKSPLERIEENFDKIGEIDTKGKQREQDLRRYLRAKDPEVYQKHWKKTLDKARMLDKLYQAEIYKQLTEIWLKSLRYHAGNQAQVTFCNEIYLVSDCLKKIKRTEKGPSFEQIKSLVRKDVNSEEWGNLPQLKHVMPRLNGHSFTLRDLGSVPRLEEESQLSSVCYQKCKSALEALNSPCHALTRLSKESSLKDIESVFKGFCAIVDKNKTAAKKFKRDVQKKNGHDAYKEHCKPILDLMQLYYAHIDKELTAVWLESQKYHGGAHTKVTLHDKEGYALYSLETSYCLTTVQSTQRGPSDEQMQNLFSKAIDSAEWESALQECSRQSIRGVIPRIGSHRLTLSHLLGPARRLEEELSPAYTSRRSSP